MNLVAIAIVLVLHFSRIFRLGFIRRPAERLRTFGPRIVGAGCRPVQGPRLSWAAKLKRRCFRRMMIAEPAVASVADGQRRSNSDQHHGADRGKRLPRTRGVLSAELSRVLAVSAGITHTRAGVPNLHVEVEMVHVERVEVRSKDRAEWAAATLMEVPQRFAPGRGVPPLANSGDAAVLQVERADVDRSAQARSPLMWTATPSSPSSTCQRVRQGHGAGQHGCSHRRHAGGFRREQHRSGQSGRNRAGLHRQRGPRCDPRRRARELRRRCRWRRIVDA